MKTVDYIEWPLRFGDTLTNHDWFPFPTHKFLGSRLVSLCIMEDRRADLGTAMILWAEAIKQDPAGTLPDDDQELASLARFPTVQDWLAVRDGVLLGWKSVHVADPATGETVVRLGSVDFLHDIVASMHKRKRSRDGARAAAGDAVRKSRIRKKMGELKAPQHIIRDDNAVHQLSEYFKHSDLYITADNVRAAMITVLGYGDNVRHFAEKAGEA